MPERVERPIGEDVMAANRLVDEGIRELAEAVDFRPATGPYVQLDCEGRVVWRRLDD